MSLSRWHSPKTSSELVLLAFLEIDLHIATGFSALDCKQAVGVTGMQKKVQQNQNLRLRVFYKYP